MARSASAVSCALRAITRPGTLHLARTGEWVLYLPAHFRKPARPRGYLVGRWTGPDSIRGVSFQPSWSSHKCSSIGVLTGE
eukprot:2183176-Prymnesium_polylepis.1